MFKIKIVQPYEWDLELSDKDDVVVTGAEPEELINDSFETINKLDNKDFTDKYLPEELVNEVEMFEIECDSKNITLTVKTSFDIESYCKENNIMYEDLFVDTISDILNDCDIKDLVYDETFTTDLWDYDMDISYQETETAEASSQMNIKLDSDVNVTVEKEGV